GQAADGAQRAGAEAHSRREPGEDGSMSIHHVALETRPADVEAEVAFWRALGFRRVEPPETLRERTTWVQREGRQVHLLYAEDPVVPPSGHTAIVAPDYE